jgi:hypothetical protein
LLPRAGEDGGIEPIPDIETFNIIVRMANYF